MKLPLPKPKIRPFRKSVHLTHRFYQITGGYRFRWYLMAALTRFLRFALYAAVIFGLV